MIHCTKNSSFQIQHDRKPIVCENVILLDNLVMRRNLPNNYFQQLPRTRYLSIINVMLYASLDMVLELLK